MNNMKEIKLGDNIKVYVSGGNHKEEIEKDLSDLIMNKFKCVLEENDEKDSVNINNTFHVDKPKGEVSYDNKGNYKITTKEQDNEEKIIRDKMEQFKKGDKVKIVQGDFKALKDKECTFLEYCKGLNKVLIQLDEINPLYVNPLDIELIKYKEDTIDIFDIIQSNEVKINVRKNGKNSFISLTNNKKRRSDYFDIEKVKIKDMYYKMMSKYYNMYIKERGEIV